MLLGEATRVYCELQSIKPGIAGEDMAKIVMRHASGAVGLVDGSYSTRRDPEPFPETLLEIEGRRGSLILSQGLELKVTSDGATTTRSVRTPLLPWTSEPWHVSQESVVNTCRRWAESLRMGREPETSGRDNLKTYTLVEAAYKVPPRTEPWRRVPERGGRTVNTGRASAMAPVAATIRLR